MNRFLSIATILLLIALPRIIGCTERQQKPDIYFILFDALRADHVGAYGHDKPATPSLDRLARDAVLFQDSSSGSVSTSSSMPRLFTGAFVQKRISFLPLWEDAAQAYPPGVSLLNADLQKQGYHTVIISAHLGLKGSELDNGFDEIHYISKEGAYASSVELSEVLREVHAKKGDKPLFVYLHAMDTHFPHPRNKYFEQFTSDPGFQSQIMNPNGNPYNSTGAPLSDQEKAHLSALYDANIRLGDDLVGNLTDMLDSCGEYEDSLIAVTADHGDLLGEGKENNKIGHADLSWQEQIAVPLIIKLPGNRLEGSRVGFPVGAVDVKPTLLSLALGPEALEGMTLSGRALFKKGKIIEEPDRILPINGGFRYGPLKIMRNGPSIFDLASDPKEENNLLASGWPENWPEGFAAVDKGVRYGNLEIHRPYPGHDDIGIFLLSQDPERRRELLYSQLELAGAGFEYPSQAFYVWPAMAKPETPDKVLDLTDANDVQLDPNVTSNTPQWNDGKWSLTRNFLWHSPDEDPGEISFTLAMNKALDGDYGVSVIMSPYHYSGGHASVARVSLDGATWMTVSTEEAGSPGYPQLSGKPIIPVGTCKVENGTLRMHLRPERELRPEDLDERENMLNAADKRHWALIYCFKYTPLGKGAAGMSDEEQEERYRQLRGLGYIQ